MARSVDEYLDLVDKRADIAEAIESEQLDLRAIRDRTGASRSTVNRAVRELEDAGLVEATGGRYTLTTVGRLALDHYRSYRAGWRDLLRATDVIEALPRDTSLKPALLAGADVAEPPEEAPYRPLERLREDLAGADRYRGALPAVPDPRHLRVLYERVVTEGRPAELVVPDELRASLAEEFPRRLEAMVGTDGFELLVGETPAFGLLLIDAGGTTTATLVIFGDDTGVAGIIRNPTKKGVRHAERQYERCRAAAEAVAADDL